MRLTVVAIVAGLLFGTGITVSGVINPAAVLRFLDVTRGWDPSLALVLVGALVVAVPAFAFVRRGAAPLFAWDYRLPGRRRIDWRLICGAVLFGVGWGLVGFSPGTALAAVGTGAAPPLIFAAAMVAGMALYRFTLGARGGRSLYGAYYARRFSRRAARAEQDKASPGGG